MARSSPTATQRSIPPLWTEVPIKALVYHGPQVKTWEEVPDATLREPTDVVVRGQQRAGHLANLTLTMGLVDTVSIPTLLTMVASGRIPAERMATHRFTVGEIDRAYEVCRDAAAHQALKVVLTP